jgi:hypothetical protein
MNASSVRKINHSMSKFHYEERKLIARIDEMAEKSPADENIMSKHEVGKNEYGERCWRF